MIVNYFKNKVLYKREMYKNKKQFSTCFLSQCNFFWNIGTSKSEQQVGFYLSSNLGSLRSNDKGPHNLMVSHRNSPLVPCSWNEHSKLFPRHKSWANKCPQRTQRIKHLFSNWFTRNEFWIISQSFNCYEC